MKWSRVALIVVLAGVFLVFLPRPTYAWTPGTHIFLGETILANLQLLPTAVADLLHAFPFDFLYGSIAPDTSIAKHYVPPGRHSHFWHVGQEVYNLAETDALRAFGLGYLAHLAADTVAHNFFVPRQLLLTSSTRTMGHSYWEIRIETHLTDYFARRAKEIIQLDHTPADRHLERIISPTIFSVQTNRRIFRGIVHLTHTRSWQRAMQAARDVSRWQLTEFDVERHLGCAYEFTMGALADPAPAARVLDPSGAKPLTLAKRMRRQTLAEGGWFEPNRLLEAAERHFGLPSLAPVRWQQSNIGKPWLNGGGRMISDG